MHFLTNFEKHSFVGLDIFSWSTYQKLQFIHSTAKWTKNIRVPITVGINHLILSHFVPWQMSSTFTSVTFPSKILKMWHTFNSVTYLKVWQSLNCDISEKSLKSWKIWRCNNFSRVWSSVQYCSCSKIWRCAIRLFYSTLGIVFE